MFMAYPGVFYATDGEILLAMQQASRTGATIMMHAENGIAIDQLVAPGHRRGPHGPGVPRPDQAARARGRGHQPGDQPWRGWLTARCTSCTVRGARAGGGRRGAGRRAERLRRDLSAVPLPVARRPRAAGLRGREVRLLAAAAHPGPFGRACGAGCAPTTCRSCPPTTARSASRSRRNSAAATSPRSPTACRASSTGWTCCTRAWSAGEITLSRWVETCATTPARMFGLYPRKGVIAAGADADIVVYDPRREADPLGRHPPHERGLLGLRGDGDHRQGRRHHLTRPRGRGGRGVPRR